MEDQSEKPVSKEMWYQAQRAMAGTIKEFGEHIKETSETAKQVLVQATKTNGRVNGIEGALVSINEILKTQQEKIQSLDTTRTKNKTIIIIASIISTPTFIILGWLGKLYIDENNRTVRDAIHTEIINEMDDKITLGIDKAFDTRFNKIKVTQ